MMQKYDMVRLPPEKAVEGNVDEERAEPLVGDEVHGHILSESLLAPICAPCRSRILSQVAFVNTQMKQESSNESVEW